MTALWRHARIQFLELARYPGFVVPSLALPLITYLMFGLNQVHGRAPAASAILVSFAAFAVLGIAMFQFGVAIATERSTPWERYLHTLPGSAISRFGGRILVALGFSLAAVVPLLVVALACTPVHLDVVVWARLAVCLLGGAVPLGLLGIMLGYLLSERSALPVTNVLFLPLAYAGGLFGYSADRLPHVIAQVSPWLPTRQWSDLLTDFGLAGRFPVHQVLALAGYGLLFATIGSIAYRRDETRQFR